MRVTRYNKTMKQPIRFVDADHIYEQAKLIRDVAERVMEACAMGQPMDPYARNKIMGGSIGSDVVALAVKISKFEMENGS